MKRSSLLIPLACLGGLALPASAAAVQTDSYARASAPDDVPPCIQADPCQKIGTALADTSPGGTVHVAPGIYNENLTVADGKSLVYDGSGAPFGAVIDGSGAAAVTVNVSGSAGTIQGFTLRSTATAVLLNGDGIVSGNLLDSTASSSLGLFATQTGTKTISGNQFTGNSANDRTGIFVFDSSPTISRNTFSGLKLGISVSGGGALIDGNEIGAGNPDAQGIEIRPGSIPTTPVITANHIQDLGSSAIRAQQLLSPVSVGATLARNRLINDLIGVDLDDTAGTVTMQSDLLVSNGTHIITRDISTNGGGDLTASNITVWGGSFGAQLFDTALALDSSIVGDAGISANGTGSCAITNSRSPVIASSLSGCSAFQTTASPQFVDLSNPNPALNDYHLAAGSPMIDQGNPAAPLGGALDLDADQRAIAGTCGGAVRRDIGADEFRPACPTSGPGNAAVNPRCATLRKKLKKAKRAGNQAKVRKIRRKLRRLGC